MRILISSNYYPPHFIGGYELGCRAVAEKLSARGHTVLVLTSTYGTTVGAAVPREPGVERILNLNDSPGAASNGWMRMVKECRIFRRVVKDFSPDVIYFWNQAGLCRWLPVCARLMGKKCAFFISDLSFVAWRVGAVLLRHANRRRWIDAVFGSTWLVKGYPVMYRQPCHFASAFLQDRAYRAEIDVADSGSGVIHWGVDMERFKNITGAGQWPPRRLLYVGQLIPQKGARTAIEALALLAKQHDFADMTLSICGGSTDPDYEKKLHALPASLGIEEKVRFLGKVAGGGLPAIYGEHDLLIFPSVWEEPFAITPLEAMASMLPVAGTLTGGSGELFRDRQTAMTFQPGDAASCAAAITALRTDHELFESIRSQAYKLVASRHTINAMASRIETALKSIASGENPA